MQLTNSKFDTAITASVRTVNAKAELYSGSALVNTYTQTDSISSIEIQRVGESGKFFGVTVCQRLNLKLIDINRTIDLSDVDKIKISLGVVVDDTIDYKTFPTFYITEVHRNENTNELSITAYDAINELGSHTVSELNLTQPVTVRQYAEQIAVLLGLQMIIKGGVSETSLYGFNLTYDESANFNGDETLRDVLTAIAEVTQTVCSLDASDNIVFRRLNTATDLNISKEDYLTFKSGNNRRLQTICSVTELGDNISISTTQSGSTQYVRDNPFWENREDLADILQEAINTVGNFTINVFECTWRGNPATEIGDRLQIITKDNDVISTYLLDDTITYNGTLQEKTSWSFTEDSETASNPATLGDKLKQTFAKVDKLNQEIIIKASDFTEYKEVAEGNFASILVKTNEISQTVESIKNEQESTLDGLAEELSQVRQSVETKMSPEAVELKISEAISNGVTCVDTGTGFIFNRDGLTIEKTDSEMKTNIDEDGMSVFRNSEEVLTVDNTGVNAINLTARQYLSIGLNSRFEDYNTTRTACFYIGG